MKRHIYKQLLEWKQADKRKPLILNGARQVGKTFILNLFGKNEYKEVIYLNFEANKRLASLFQSDLTPAVLMEGIRVLTQRDPTVPDTLLIFDEIQACPNALTSLKYFEEQAPHIHVIGAGSLLGVKLSQAAHFPVGKVTFLDLYPMSFYEFLEAMDLSPLTAQLYAKKDFKPLPEYLHETLMDWLKKYLIIGGMPEVVKTYIETKRFDAALLIQQEILRSYTHDFSKYAEPTDIMRIMDVWDKIPSQLSRENKKFMFSAIKQSARSRDYDVSIQWLCNAGLILKATHVSVPKLPLASYAETNAFKVYMLDSGLLSSLCDVNPSIALEKELLFQEFKGAITENFVAQELTVALNKKLYYWTSGSSAEVDFIFNISSNIFPLEVKSGFSKHKKSLLSYFEKYKPSLMIRANPMNFYQDNHFCNIPLYAVGILPAMMDGFVNQVTYPSSQ